MSRAIKKALMMSPVLFGLAACGDMLKQEEAMPDRQDGAMFFAANCASCHGMSGNGDGPEANSLAVPPSDLTMLSDNNGGTFPRARALSYIYGEPGDNHLSRVMPEFGGAMADDLVPVDIDGILTPTPRELAGLLFYLESIQE